MVSPSAVQAKGSGTTGARRRVLVVEDEPTTYLGLCQLLGHYEYDVIHAPTLEAGRKFVEAGAPDFVCLDLGLPDGDGEGLLRIIRRQYPMTPVAVITASSDVERLGRVKALSPAAVMSKPVEFLELLMLLRNG